jgi:hypothetical protein
LHTPKQSLDLLHVKNAHAGHLRPIGASGWNSELHGHSFLSFDGRNREESSTLIELSDDACVFTVQHDPITPDTNERKLPLQWYERGWFVALTDNIRLLRTLKVEGPLSIRIALFGVKGTDLRPRPAFQYRQGPRLLEHDAVILEPVKLSADLDGTSMPVIAAALRHSFLVVWRDGGMDVDPCFDKDGNLIQT